MKLKFEPDLEFQIDAIQSVTDLFKGLPPKQSKFEISPWKPNGAIFNDLGVGNSLMLEKDQLLMNLHTVQERNLVPKSRFL
jgi:type III restriction enzyme